MNEREVDTQFAELPEQMELREVTIHVTQRGRRTRIFTLVTTLLDPADYTQADLADLYQRRWDAELNLRSLKVTLRMDVLRCTTPAMVEKELWTHLLAYNAVRMLMAQAAATHRQCPTRPGGIPLGPELQRLTATAPRLPRRRPAGRRFRGRRTASAAARHRPTHCPAPTRPRRAPRRQTPPQTPPLATHPPPPSP